MQLTVTETPIKGLIIIETKIFEDERGFFMESYSKRDFTNAGITDEFVQENHSRSGKGVIRGLHYQNMSAPMAKLVRCTHGRVFDVAVDIRTSSATFGQWFGIELSSENKNMFYVPVGFAHGFQTLTDEAELQYKQTNYYNPYAEGTILWNDEDIKIKWPLTEQILSNKDKLGVTLRQYRENPVFS